MIIRIKERLIIRKVFGREGKNNSLKGRVFFIGIAKFEVKEYYLTFL